VTCVKCKKEIPDGSLFCSFCGKKQTAEQRKTLKRPNGAGTVYKLSGRRRKPWVAAKNKAILGYYETKTAALESLEAFAKRDITELFNMTLCGIYVEWSKEHLGGLSSHGKESYENSWKHLSTLGDRKMRSLRTDDYQAVINSMIEANKKRATTVKVRSLMTQLNKWAMREDIVEKDFSSFVRLPKDDSEEKKIFTQKQIDKLFEKATDPCVRVILILIYSGLRIGELMAITKENVHLDEDYMIGGIKSEAGKNRIVPINPKIKMFISELYHNAPSGGKLMHGYDGNRSPANFRKREFVPTLESLGMFGFTPHSTRHTCASLMVAAGIPRELIQKILGHAQYSTTADYYVHKNAEELVAAIKSI